MFPTYCLIFFKINLTTRYELWEENDLAIIMNIEKNKIYLSNFLTFEIEKLTYEALLYLLIIINNYNYLFLLYKIFIIQNIFMYHLYLRRGRNSAK